MGVVGLAPSWVCTRPSTGSKLKRWWMCFSVWSQHAFRGWHWWPIWWVQDTLELGTSNFKSKIYLCCAWGVTMCIYLMHLHLHWHTWTHPHLTPSTIHAHTHTPPTPHNTHPTHSTHTHTHTHRSSTYSCTRFSRITWTHLINMPTLLYCKYQRLYSSYASQVRYTVVTVCVCVDYTCTAIYSCSRISEVQVRVFIGF